MPRAGNANSLIIFRPPLLRQQATFPPMMPTIQVSGGMKIIQSLVKQIGGTLQFGSGEHGRGTRVTVAFESPLCLERRKLEPVISL